MSFHEKFDFEGLIQTTIEKNVMGRTEFPEELTLTDELVSNLLENPGEVAYQMSAFYPKVIYRAIDMLIQFVRSQGPLKKRALEVLLRISVNDSLQDKYRQKARAGLKNAGE